MRVLTASGVARAGARPELTGSFLVRDCALIIAPTGFGDLPASDAFTSARDKLAFAAVPMAIAAGFKGRPGEAIGAAIARLTRSLPAQAAIMALVRVSTYANAPEHADATAALDQLRLSNSGVLFLDDGWEALVQAVAAQTRATGAAIETGARAEAAMRDGAIWRIRFAAGERVARALVLALAPDEARRIAPGVARLEDAVLNAAPVRAACLDLGLTHWPEPARAFALVLDAPTYFSVRSKTARGLAPAGGALIHVARYLGPEERPGRDTRSELEALADLMQPGWRTHVAAEQFLPMATVTHYMPQAARGGLAGRCPVALAPALFAAGD
jgi:phytoene dehydrogenase-like protein